MRFVGRGGRDSDTGVRRALVRLRVAGDSAESSFGVAGRDSRQTTVRDTTDRTGLQTSVLRGGPVARRAVRVASSRGDGRLSSVAGGLPCSRDQLRRLTILRLGPNRYLYEKFSNILFHLKHGIIPKRFVLKTKKYIHICDYSTVINYTHTP